MSGSAEDKSATKQMGNRMRFILLIGLTCAALPAAAGAESIERGKYIVERVGLCIDCHTPRDTSGQPIAAQHLHGAPIGFRPMQPMPFAEQAPPLAGAAGALYAGANGYLPADRGPPRRLDAKTADATLSALEGRRMVRGGLPEEPQAAAVAAAVGLSLSWCVEGGAASTSL